MRQLVLAVAAAAALSGCDRMQAAFTPVPEKILAAFPLPDDVELARSRLFAALESDPAARDAAARQFAQLLTARGLACTASQQVGRFDTPASIKGRGGDKQCFAKQNAMLADWVGIRRVALVLRAPPLAAVSALPPVVPLPNKLDNLGSTHLAADANVLVLRSHRQEYQVLEVPSTKEIASFTLSEPNAHTPNLSPNGRLLAVPGPKVLRFLEAESGKELWTTDKYQRVMAWIPQWDLVVLAEPNTGAPIMLDTRTGQAEPYPSAEKRPSWALLAPEGRLLMGSNTTLSLMQHARSSGGTLEAQPVQQWTVTEGTSGNTPFLVNGGKRLVFPTRDLGWLDLATGQQGTWQLAAIAGASYTQVGDSTIAFYATVPDAPGMRLRLLDTEKSTIAFAKETATQLFSLSPRPALVRRGSGAIALVSALEPDGDPQDVARVVSEAMLARELQKLQDPAPRDSDTFSSGFMPQHADAARRVERPVTAAAIPMGKAAPMAPGKPMLDVPPGTRIAMLGVYEAARVPNVPHGTVSVHVAPGSTPLVLVLSSYESVNWMIRPNGRKITAILLSSYVPSKVYGHGNTPLVRIAFTHSAYKMDSEGYNTLRREVARYVGGATPVFQGTYSGQEFQVN